MEPLINRWMSALGGGDGLSDDLLRYINHIYFVTYNTDISIYYFLEHLHLKNY